MAQANGINLLPDQSREAKQSQKSRQTLTLLGFGLGAVGLLLILASVGFRFFLDRQNDTITQQITQDTTKLNSLQQVEVRDRSLIDKLTKLQTLLSNYPQNSILLNDVASFTPSGVKLSSLIFDQTGKVAISGLATDPQSFGNFLATLRDPSKGGTKFSNVEIVALTGAGTQSQYHFTLSMLKKGKS